MIIKRNGDTRPFELTKIYHAVEKAFASRHIDVAPGIIFEKIKSMQSELGSDDSKDPVSIEVIQDKIIDVLFEHAPKDVTKSYITYRTQRAIARQEYDPIGIIETYLKRTDDMLEKENSSMAFSLQGLNNALFSAGSEQYWLRLLPAEAKEAHKKGYIHMHDLNLLGAYCMGWDLKQLLEEGFKNGRKDKTDALPAKHFGTALGQMVNFIYTLQGEIAGANSFSNVNTLLAPFVRADGLTYKQIKQAIQKHIFDLNTPTRVGYMAPFSNYTLDLDVTKTSMANEPVIIGGKFQSTCYKDYQEEARLIAEAVVEVMLEGDANKAMFPYPIVTYNVTKEFPWASKLGKAIVKATIKYGPFYFANFINSELAESDVKSMCCRLRLNLKKVLKHAESGLNAEDLATTHQMGGGFFGASPMTGSVAVATVSLPAMAKEAMDALLAEQKLTFKEITEHSKKDEIKYQLKHYIDICMNGLMTRRKIVEHYMDLGLYPYAKHYMRHIKKRTGKYFAQHFNTIGINGMHEALIILGYANGMISDEGYKLAGELLEYMNKYTVELQKEYGVLVNLEQTPAESAGVKLCRKSGIDPEGKGYYTNSTWYPAEYTADPIELVQKQAELNKHYTGGSALHLYTYEDMRLTEDMIGTFITKIFSNTNMPYVSISPIFSVCSSDNCSEKYIPGETDTCPTCGSKAVAYARIVGYYRPINNWNDGRRAEQKVRTGFNLPKAMLPVMPKKEVPQVNLQLAAATV